MHTEHCTYKGCDTHFTKPNKSRARQAIQMHIARTHTKTMLTPTGPQNGVHHRHRAESSGNGNGHTGILVATQPDVVQAIPHGHCKFTAPQLTGILEFLRTRSTEFSNRTACFKAALEANSANGLIVASTTAVNRYFAKALGAKGNGHSNGKTKRKYTRKYTRKAKPEAAVAAAPVAQKTINFCQHCGQSIKAQALGSVLAERILAGAVVTIDGERLNYAG